MFIEIDTDNAAFDGENRDHEIKRILSGIDGSTNRLKDINGNFVGRVSYSNEDKDSILFYIESIVASAHAQGLSAQEITERLTRIVNKFT